MKRILFTAFMAVSMGLVAQQDAHYTMYLFNQQMLNPGYVGSRGALSFTTSYRKQWTGFPGSPKTLFMGGHTTLGQTSTISKVAVGLSVYHDNIGVDYTTGIFGQYAYRVPLRNEGVISFGIQAGIMNYLALNQNLKIPNAGIFDPAAQNSQAVLPNVGFGIYYYHKRYFVGASIPHLIQNSLAPDHPVINGAFGRLARHYYFMGGYVWEVSDQLKLRPSLTVKYANDGDRHGPIDAHFSLGAFLFDDGLLFGAAYRPHESVDAFAQLQITKYLRLGYAYDIPVGRISSYHSGSHEISMGLDLGRATRGTGTTGGKSPSYF